MYKRKYFFVILILWMNAGFYGFAQNVDVGLARSSPSYMVTPGDVYTLTFSVGGNRVSHIIVVDTAYRLRVANLGIVNAEGQTFEQVRARVEAIVANNHPLSGPQLVITEPATFRIFVGGEVRTAGERSAWGLTRLSSLVDDSLTRFASTRDVSVRSANGQVRVFDLFQFWRFGDQTQNPYLRPGDLVTFNRVSRLVTVQGAVERPGVYQLLEGENIRELIELYGHGFTPLADSTRMEIVRRLGHDDVSARLFLTVADLENNFVLENYDVVSVPAVSDLMPVLFVEGAVGLTVPTGVMRMDYFNVSNRITVQFHVGETYASMARRNRQWFSAISDTENAYVIRRGEVIPINLNLALFDAAYRGEVEIQNHDTLVIPFRQFFVTVSGAVARPGRFPFIPDRGWEYYIGMAGGFVPGRNARDRIVITDINGRQLRPTDPITPETVIFARSNHPLFVFRQYAPVITTVLSAISTTLTIMILLDR